MTVPEDVATLMESIGFTGKVEHNCHVVSLAIVQSGVYPKARVARGWAPGIDSQHSWVAIWGDPYDSTGGIIDATRWSYDDRIPGVWLGTLAESGYRPHGAGHFMTAGMPHNHGGREVRLIVNHPLSADAVDFLRILGPLDYSGWAEVAHLPVEGWPAREIIGAMLDTPQVAVLVPIDIAGMITDRNPQGIYLPTTNKEQQQ